MSSKLFERIYKVVSSIPEGKVATYGQVAALAGHPGAARVVGWALHSAPEPLGLPWHRVISATGKSSLPERSARQLQQALLEQEGVRFDRQGRVDLATFQWQGHEPAPRAS